MPQLTCCFRNPFGSVLCECKLRAAEVSQVVFGGEPKSAEEVDLLMIFQPRHTCRKVICRKSQTRHILMYIQQNEWLPAEKQPWINSQGGLIQPSKYTFISCQVSSDSQLVWLRTLTLSCLNIHQYDTPARYLLSYSKSKMPENELLKLISYTLRWMCVVILWI